MPLASDARPRGGAREGGKGGALRWSAPIEKTSRPEPEKRRRGTRRYAEGGAPEFQQSGARGTPSLSGRDTRGGRGARVGGHDGGRADSSRGDAAMSDHRGSDGSNTWGEEEHFDRAFAALAEEMEHELVEMSPSPVPSHRVARRGGRQHDTDRSLETETEYASTEGLPDASQFRAASRVAVGRFIREFRGVDGASDWKRGDTTHDDDVLSASPVFNLGRGARARRNGDAVASTSAASSRLSDEWHSPSKRERGDDNVRRSGGFLAASTDDTDLDIAWARWGGGEGDYNRGNGPSSIGGRDEADIYGKRGPDALGERRRRRAVRRREPPSRRRGHPRVVAPTAATGGVGNGRWGFECGEGGGGGRGAGG